MSYIGNLDFCSDIWTKFKHLYQNIGFIEQNIILMQLSNKTASDFKNIVHFTNSLK